MTTKQFNSAIDIALQQRSQIYHRAIADGHFAREATNLADACFQNLVERALNAITEHNTGAFTL